jgi:hypothetical protein
VKIVTIAFASAIALSAIAPAFAYENDLENGATSSMQPSGHRAAAKHTNMHRATDAKAFVPDSAPAMNAPAAVVAPYDFGIGNQGT